MNPPVRRRFVGWSVCHYFSKGTEVSLPTLLSEHLFQPAATMLSTVVFFVSSSSKSSWYYFASTWFWGAVELVSISRIISSRIRFISSEGPRHTKDGERQIDACMFGSQRGIDRGCSGNIVFFHNSLQPLPRLHIAVRDLQSSQRYASVQSFLLAGNFLYNQ